MAVTPVLLAHQGGWDEILMVLVPIALFAALLVIANRRASVIEARRGADESAAERSAPGRRDGRPDGPGR
jgi:hypothetical protein